MRTCGTCSHLAVPANADHARHYYVCKALTPLPANMHVGNRDQVEGRVEGPERWIARKWIDERKPLRDCELHGVKMVDGVIKTETPEI